MNRVPELTRRPALTGGLFRTVLMGLFIVPWVVLWGSLSVLSGVLKCGACFRTCLGTWSRGLLLIAGVRLKITRHGQLDPARPYVFLANHQSALDIPFLSIACLQTSDVRFMAKESLFKVPFLGWGIARNGFIPIRRDNARHSAEMFREITEAKGKIKHSFIIFPEGTRSEDGRLQEFKKGSIALVLRLGFAVVPVTVVDACRANPKGKTRVRSGDVHVVFHEPIELPESPGRNARDELLNRVHAAVASALPDDQRPLPSSVNDAAKEAESVG